MLNTLSSLSLSLTISLITQHLANNKLTSSSNCNGKVCQYGKHVSAINFHETLFTPISPNQRALFVPYVAFYPWQLCCICLHSIFGFHCRHYSILHHNIMRRNPPVQRLQPPTLPTIHIQFSTLFPSLCISCCRGEAVDGGYISWVLQV